MFRGASVSVVLDRDKAGYARGVELHGLLTAVGATVRLLLPAVEGEHADFTDHLAAGKGLDDLVLVSPVEVAALAAIRGADTDQRGTYTEDEFWLSRPELRHIQLFARARRAAPWAVLAVVLTRVCLLYTSDAADEED